MASDAEAISPEWLRVGKVKYWEPRGFGMMLFLSLTWVRLERSMAYLHSNEFVSMYNLGRLSNQIPIRSINVLLRCQVAVKFTCFCLLFQFAPFCKVCIE